MVGSRRLSWVVIWPAILKATKQQWNLPNSVWLVCSNWTASGLLTLLWLSN